MAPGAPATGVIEKRTKVPPRDAATTIGVAELVPAVKVFLARPSSPEEVFDEVRVPTPETTDQPIEAPPTGFPNASATLTTSGGAAAPTVADVLLPDTIVKVAAAPGSADAVNVTVTLGNAEV